ncbi:MAG: hypothetical protein J5I90_07015 [Caldilineales bacterium]|nr:hypothetical protein [Caldilineales bacterium]
MILPNYCSVRALRARTECALINDLKLDDSASIDIPPGYTVFCDMDGTLVDTDYANYLSYRRAVIEATRGMHDVEFSNERLNRESLRKRLPSLSAAQLELITSLKTEYFIEFVSETRLNTALACLITKHRGKNPIVLVTRCREMRAVEVLKHHKMLECFSRLICWEALPQGGSSNKHGNAISLMGVCQEAVIIFENDNFDVEQAMLAGVSGSNIYRVSSWSE